MSRFFRYIFDNMRVKSNDGNTFGGDGLNLIEMYLFYA